MEPKFKIRRDDQVEITAGKDKGKRGTVVKIDREKGRVIVSGANLVKKALKRRSQQDQKDHTAGICNLYDAQRFLLCQHAFFVNACIPQHENEGCRSQCINQNIFECLIDGMHIDGQSQCKQDDQNDYPE